jgi:hypothetical protein
MDKPLKPKKEKQLTALGEIYFNGAKAWQRTKILTEMKNELGVDRHLVRSYMVTTPAFRMRADMKEIILRTLPEAESCFIDPRVQTTSQPV